MCGPESSFTVWSPRSVNEGSSLTEFTVIVNVWLGAVSSPPFKVPPLSVTNTVTVALPEASAVSVYVSSPFASIAGPAAKSAALSSVTVYVNVWAASSAPPPGSTVAKPATVYGPESSFTVWSAPSVNEGSSLTGFTVIVKVWAAAVSSPPNAVPPESVTKTVTVALPLASAVSV